MTEAEKKEVIRVCGPDYEESDIPAYIRQRDAENAEDERFDYHPRPEEV